MCTDMNQLKNSLEKVKKIIVPAQKNTGIIKELEFFLGK